MERYRVRRQHAEFHMKVETGDGTVVAQVVDVNEYGMRLCGDLTIEVGEDITASLTDWELSGVVKWVRPPYCGILFDHRAPGSSIAEMRGTAIANRRPIRKIRMTDML